MSMSSMPDAVGSAGNGDPTAGDSSMQGADGSDEGQSGYTICIYVNADNKISVDVKQGTDDDDDGDDDSAGGDDTDNDSGAQPVKSLNDLVSLVKDIVRSGGQMNDQGDEDFKAGAGE